MKNYSNVISLIIVFALWLGLVIGCGRGKGYTGQAPAVVTQVSKVGRFKSNPVYRTYFSYTVNGKTYQANSEERYSYPIGTQAKACYMPSDPQQAYFALPDGTCR